ncbi:MAG: LLM class F420-dependent oxidoreductase [Actinobacteria bacterium]|jgi:probable F420-dependent oxidoreductase|nr:LLM class F420-dependent oxidoreductase [Actinomycetota bacterium]MCL6095610.1 LLM class F420-dependent oxidoreductase [Actinomycetota bacterium]
MQLGQIGIWTSALDRQPAKTATAAAAEIDRLGYGALWVGEAIRREAFSNAALLLSATKKVTVCTGIANIWARDALAMKAGQFTLAEAWPDRFLLGIGVSHAPLLSVRGQRYSKPLEVMAAYLEAMDNAPYDAPNPPIRPLRVLAALGPKMLELAGSKADGAHTYFVPVEHSEQARAILGPNRLLCAEQAVVLENSPAKAREIARRHTRVYLGLSNYSNNLKRLGFDDDDLSGGGSDRLVDAIVAWGDVDAVAERIDSHLQAGASHVAIQVLTDDPNTLPLSEWKILAEVLIDA